MGIKYRISRDAASPAFDFRQFNDCVLIEIDAARQFG